MPFQEIDCISMPFQYNNRKLIPFEEKIPLFQHSVGILDLFRNQWDICLQKHFWLCHVISVTFGDVQTKKEDVLKILKVKESATVKFTEYIHDCTASQYRQDTKTDLMTGYNAGQYEKGTNGAC